MKMAEIKTIYKGESVTLLFTFPEAYDMARLVSHKVFVGETEFTGVVEGQAIKMQLKSSDTNRMIGTHRIVCSIDDTTLGLRKPYCGELVIAKTQASGSTASVSNISDIIIPVVISETAVTVGDILYNYVKGDKGDPFTYSDFTPEQIEALKVKGDAFEYSDFTPEQIALLQKPASDIATTVSNAEGLRVTAETNRNNAESLRLSAEIIRNENEAARIEAEGLRAGAETGRQTAEGLRVTAEGLRVTAESGRTTAESGRVTAENNRATAESGRVTAESGRVTAESGRVIAENNRATAESGRVTAESVRNTKEGERQTKEAERIAAEINRQPSIINNEQVQAETYNVLNARILALEEIIRNMAFATAIINKVDVVDEFNIHGITNLILKGTTAPSITPDFIGQTYINTTAGTTYTAKGITNSGDWKQTSN